MAHRRLQRNLMLQMLYARDLRGEHFPLEEEFDYLITRFFSIPLEAEEREEVLERLRNTTSFLREIDTVIEKASSSWSLDKMSIVDRNILRVAIYEMVYEGNDVVPLRIVINEAVELAKQYSSDKAYRFVNGLLGAVYRSLGEPGADYEPPRDIPYEEMEVDKKVAAVVYSRDAHGAIRIGLVHDIFGYWTLSKGSVDPEKGEEASLVEAVREETGWDVEVLEELGESEYIAYPPDRGAVRKQVRYYLAKSDYVPPRRPEPGGGLDDVRWFPPDEILELNLYRDVSEMLTKAIPRIFQREGLSE